MLPSESSEGDDTGSQKVKPESTSDKTNGVTIPLACLAAHFHSQMFEEGDGFPSHPTGSTKNERCEARFLYLKHSIVVLVLLFNLV